MLYYTALLFCAVVFTAHAVGSTHHVIISTCMLATSLLHHGKRGDQYPGKRLVTFLDLFFAHLIVFNELVRNVACSNDLTVYSCVVYIVFTHLINKYALGGRHDVHATIHVVGTFGACTSLVKNSPHTCKVIYQGC